MDATLIALQWTQASLANVHAIAQRGAGEGHVSLSDMQSMMNNIPGLALETYGLKDAAAAMAKFSRAPRKNMGSVFKRVNELCEAVDNIFTAQSPPGQGSGMNAAAPAVTASDDEAAHT